MIELKKILKISTHKEFVSRLRIYSIKCVDTKTGHGVEFKLNEFNGQKVSFKKFCSSVLKGVKQ